VQGKARSRVKVAMLLHRRRDRFPYIQEHTCKKLKVTMDIIDVSVVARCSCVTESATSHERDVSLRIEAEIFKLKRNPGRRCMMNE
jgi:hypothetical protein